MNDRPTSGPAPGYGEYGPRVEPAARVEQAPIVAVPTASATAARAPRRWDAVLTAALLALGLYVTFASIPQMLSLGSVLDEVYTAGGYGHYTSDGVASTIGIVINIVHVVLLIAAFAVALPRLRRGKIAFWAPLGAGVLATVVGSVLIGVAMFSDPAMMQYINTLATTSPTPSP